MCGIVGYIGEAEAYPILIKGLHRLEYRGYDSAGVSMINAKGDLNVYKATGKVAALEEKCAAEDTTGSIGIAHTRWATHGEPNTVNAHPHLSQSKNLSLVHNGIIENYKTLRVKLEKEGYDFCSDTDTEVLVQLIEYTQKTEKCDLFTAVQRALKNVIGAYAIAILQKDHPDQLVCARKGSPLVIGVGTDARGQKEFYLGSDATPIVEYTKQVIYLKDEEIAYMDRSGKIDIVNLANVHQTPEMHTLSLSLDELEKGGFPHFMLKEIWEQPNALRTCIKGRLHHKRKDITLSGIIEHKDKFINARRIIICACGTSWHSALIGKYFIEEAAQIPVEVEYASSTKAFTGQVITLCLLGLAIAKEKHTLSDEMYHMLVDELYMIPDKMQWTLENNKNIDQFAQMFTYCRNFIFLGRGYNYPVALEGALKLKEISYLHAEGYPAAEMKHGPIALVDEEMPVVFIAPKRGMYDKIVSNIQEIKSRKGKIISVVTEGDTTVRNMSDYCFVIPDTRDCFVPMLSVIPLQLLAYYIATAKGRNVDQPRNLAKSVTVE